MIILSRRWSITTQEIKTFNVTRATKALDETLCRGQGKANLVEGCPKTHAHDAEIAAWLSRAYIGSGRQLSPLPLQTRAA